MSPIVTPVVRVFIAGGCYAGLSAALNLLDIGDGLSPRMAHETYTHHPDLPKVNFQITIADERDGYFHLIGSPLALADQTFAKKAWVKYSDIPALQHPNITVVQGTVASVDPAARTATVLDNATKLTATFEYDYFVCATGLRRVWPVVPQSLNRKQYLLEAEEHIYSVTNARHGVVVVGGGAVGIEMAAELKLVSPQTKVTLVHSRAKLLSSEDLSDECKDKALELLLECGVEVRMETRLAGTKQVEAADGASSPQLEVDFTDGSRIAASQVIMAVSKSEPTTGYLPSSVLNEEGYVKIQPNLRFPEGTPNAEFHYCGGDAAQWSGIKRCGGAMHGGHYAACNIHETVREKLFGADYKPQLKELVHYPSMIGLAVGKKAVASGPDGTVFGEDVMQSYFRDDLGFDICWGYIGLGGKEKEVKA